MKPKKITTLKGVLLRSPGTKLGFRVYDDDGEFTDYDIAHLDLDIQIHDEDAYIYDTPKGKVIDYSPQTLGHDEK